MDAEQMPEYALGQFRGTYGRYCVLVAQLVKTGASRDAIISARSTRLPGLPRFAAVYDAWQECRRLRDALSGRPDVTQFDLADAVRDAKAAVESEWECKIPMVTGRDKDDSED